MIPTLSRGRESKGVFSFAKENTPFGTPRERPDRQPRSRRNAAPPEWKCLRGGLAPLAAIGSAIRFDLLLLPAAALPISQKYSLIPVYRWCQSRRRAQQSRRCAGSPPPSKRHSRATECARLIPVTTRRRLVAKPRTPHLIPQAAQLFKIETANVRGQGARPLAFLWGFQRGYSLRKENTPFVWQQRKELHYLCSASGAATTHPREGRSKRDTLFEKRIPPLPGSGAQRRTIHAAQRTAPTPSPVRRPTLTPIGVTIF